MSGHTQQEAELSLVPPTMHTQCPLCQSSLSDPVLLPCLHSACAPCLAGYLAGGDHKADVGTGTRTPGMPCPVCQTNFAKPESGIEALAKNHFLSHLVELETCQGELPKSCDYCRYEQRETTAECHCLQCDDHLCASCAEAHHRTKLTRSHTVVPLSEIQGGKFEGDIRGNQVVACEVHPSEALRYFCLKCDTLICRECKVGEHEKHQCSDMSQVSRSFHKKCTPLLESVKGKIPVMKDHVKLLADYSTQVTLSKDTLISGIESQAEQLHQMVEKYKADMTNAIIAAADKECKTAEEKTANTEHTLMMLESAASYGSFFFQKAKPEEILLARNLVRDRLAALSYASVDALTSKLSMHFTNGPSSASHLHAVFGKLEIYSVPLTTAPAPTPQEPPTTTYAHSSGVVTNVGDTVRMLHSFECTGYSDTKDIWPTGVAIDHRDHIVVVDRENKSVKVFEKDGRIFCEFGRKLLGCPYDVTVLPNHNLAVTDHEDEDIKIFLPNGDLINTIKGKVKYPRGITHNSRGYLLVVDAHHRKIRLIDPLEGHQMGVIQGEDSELYFQDPYYVAANKSDDVIVSDWSSPHIKIFTSSGRLVTTYGCGSREQKLQPYGVCTDERGYILVADNQNHSIHLLAPDGKFLRLLLGKEHGLWHPMAVAVTQAGQLVVTEALGKVKVFQYM